MPRVRLDQLVVERGLARSRAEAQSLLMAGALRLSSSDVRGLKPGQLVASDAELLSVPGPRWASRGGEKLSAALDAFAVDPGGLACLDAGASTGGFTDVLLEHRARVVYAVDVGRGQLVERLQRDPRVVVMDRTNLRTLVSLPEPIQLATLDLSFISLALVLPTVRRLLEPDGRLIALVKPQFEAGREAVPRGGVVRDPAVHRDVLLEFGEAVARSGFAATRVIRSPITGSSGNVEFLALAGPQSADAEATRQAWREAVDLLFGPSV
jgi:23S rRNA (cytidine1920-2'-O)/16S rRNA (cytidine1409-2'-O)-methyltransferase